MTRLEDRQILVRDIEQACGAGARLAPAWAVAGIDARTLQRWKAGDGLSHGDHRVEDTVRPGPSHALSTAERAGISRSGQRVAPCRYAPARISDARRRGHLSRKRVELPPGPGCARPDASAWACPAAAKARFVTCLAGSREQVARSLSAASIVHVANENSIVVGGNLRKSILQS